MNERAVGAAVGDADRATAWLWAARRASFHSFTHKLSSCINCIRGGRERSDISLWMWYVERDAGGGSGILAQDDTANE